MYRFAFVSVCVEIHEPSVGHETFPVMSQLD